MKEARVVMLAQKIANLVLSEVDETKTTPLEVAYALGEALAVVIAKPYLERLNELGELHEQPGDGDKGEGGEELKLIYSEEEMEYARKRLSSMYPLETVIQIAKGDLKFPAWLQKEILERRG